jgi:hypothetical protein
LSIFHAHAAVESSRFEFCRSQGVRRFAVSNPDPIMKRLVFAAVCLGLLAVAGSLIGVRTAATPVLLERHVLADAAAQERNGSDEPPVTPRACVWLLLQGRDWLKTVPDYSADFRKQERIGEELHPLEIMDLKLRHEPFSVAMNWHENGRRICYRDGFNQNRLSVRLGGWKRRLGWINLDPNSSMAMQQSRYPITDVGLLRLTEQLLERLDPYLDRTEGVRCAWLADEAVSGRRCRVFTVDYADPAVNPDYRQSVIWLDAERNIPLSVQNFDWQSHDPTNPAGLVEFYIYENLRFSSGLQDADFTAEGEPASSAEVAAAGNLTK